MSFVPPLVFSSMAAGIRETSKQRYQTILYNMGGYIPKPPSTNTSVVQSIASLLDLPFGFAPAAHTLSVAVERGDNYEASRAIAKLAEGIINVVNYPLMAVQNIALAVQFVPEYLGQILPAMRPELAAFLAGGVLASALASLGAAAATFGVIYNSVELSNQREVDVHLHKDSIKDILTELNKIDFDKLFDTFPDYLKKEIKEKAELQGDSPKGFFRGLSNDIEGTGHTRAKEMIEKIQKASPRQQVVQILKIAACTLAVVAFVITIGLHLVCPHLILVTLSIGAIALGATALILKKGWVENSGDGLDFSTSLPSFLQREEEKEIELTGERKVPQVSSILEASSEAEEGI